MSKKKKHKNKKKNKNKTMDSQDTVNKNQEPAEAPEEITPEPEAPEEHPADEDSVAEAEQPIELSEEEKLTLELADTKEQVLRARADFDNYRKRMAREMERVRKVAADALIQDMLPGIDNLGLALMHADENSDALKQGVSMVHKQLLDALGNHGLKPIEAMGQAFDPNVHEAVQQVTSTTVEKDHVVQVFQNGYMLGDMILRPARVVVSTGKPDDTQEPSAESSAPAEQNN